MQQVTPELAQSLNVADARGALVSGVEPGGPADHAGIKQGDVIVALDGQRVTDANAVRNQIAGTRPASMVSIDVLRSGKTQTQSVRLVERTREQRVALPPARGESTGGSSFGMAVSPLTPEVAEQLRLPRTETGLVVTVGRSCWIAAASSAFKPGTSSSRRTTVT